MKPPPPATIFPIRPAKAVLGILSADVVDEIPYTPLYEYVRRRRARSLFRCFAALSHERFTAVLNALVDTRQIASRLSVVGELVYRIERRGEAGAPASGSALPLPTHEDSSPLLIVLLVVVGVAAFVWGTWQAIDGRMP